MVKLCAMPLAIAEAVLVPLGGFGTMVIKEFDHIK
jgi:hypothetical protein